MRLLRLSAVFLLALLSTVAVQAGEVSGQGYRAVRFAPFALNAPAGQWLALDREASGGNEDGGPLVEFKATQAAGSVYPVVMVNAFKRVNAEVTADFLLRTSLDALRQRGAEPGPVLVRTVDGKKVRFFEARLQRQGVPSVLYYVLLEGEKLFFAAQAVVPAADFAAAQRQIDALLAGARY